MKAEWWIAGPPTEPRVIISIGGHIFSRDFNGEEWTLEATQIAAKVVDYWKKNQFPAGSIPFSECEAIEAAGMLCIPGDFVKMIYHQCEGRGWVDGAGNPIKNFRSHIQYRWQRERKAFEEAGKEKQSIWEMKQALEEIGKRINAMTDTDSLAYDSYRDSLGKLTAENKTLLTKLRARKFALENELMGLE